MNQPQFEPLSQPMIDLIDEMLEEAKDFKDIFLQTAIFNEIMAFELGQSDNNVLNELTHIYKHEPHRLMYHFATYYYKNTL
jgi:hypothetical protein